MPVSVNPLTVRTKFALVHTFPLASHVLLVKAWTLRRGTSPPLLQEKKERSKLRADSSPDQQGYRGFSPELVGRGSEGGPALVACGGSSLRGVMSGDGGFLGGLAGRG